jgi:predicted nucleic acid-binding protein
MARTTPYQVGCSTSRAQAKRLGRLTARAHQASLSGLVALWPQMQVAEVDQQLVARAAALADSFELRGYDAVHCASAAQLQDDSLVAASGDLRLLRAWQQIGLATYDTNVT